MKIIDDKKTGLFVSATKDDRNVILGKDIIFSTYQMSRDGLDVPSLDCVVFCTPVSNIEQAVGRIVRTCDGKKSPVIIDLVDSGSVDMMKRSSYRKKFYTQKGWKLEEKKL